MSAPVVKARACTERASAVASGSVCTRTSEKESPSAADMVSRTAGSSGVPRPRRAEIWAVTSGCTRPAGEQAAAVCEVGAHGCIIPSYPSAR